jgi:hypothetical protein
MSLRTVSLVLTMASAASLGACATKTASSANSADTVSDGGSDAGVQEGSPCETNDDCASALESLTCVTDPSDGSQSCALCAGSALAAVAAVCSGDVDGGDAGAFDVSQIQFSNDGTCGVDSCTASDGGDDKAQCRLFETCPDGQHWSSSSCGCVDGSPGTLNCHAFETCSAGKVWSEASCSCISAPTCDSAGGTCVALSPGSCTGTVIEGSCGSKFELGLECCSE